MVVPSLQMPVGLLWPARGMWLPWVVGVAGGVGGVAVVGLVGGVGGSSSLPSAAIIMAVIREQAGIRVSRMISRAGMRGLLFIIDSFIVDPFIVDSPGGSDRAR